MKPVGLRELKARLSHYIRQVRTGRHILVSDRGEIVAELSPPGRASSDSAKIPAALAALVRRGHVSLGAPPVVPVYKEFKSGLRTRTSAELLDAERGPR